MAGRPLLGLVSLIILIGGIVMLFLVVLSGAVVSEPVNQIYFLEADTTGIDSPGTQNPSRWTFFSICGRDAFGKDINCTPAKPAMPFDPPNNFGTQDGVPPDFIGTTRFYYLSRIMFAFYLIALFFAILALFGGLLAVCSRLGGYVAGFTTFLAFAAQAIAASLMTAWAVDARNAFQSNNHTASLGVMAFAFTWAALACFLISSLLFCHGGATSNRHRHAKSVRRRSSTRSRGSFRDSESHRRIKDEYV